ncbi:response regulator transcription factor [Flavobacterium amniphilum]|uniref:response regulator transcription factor n=1 Tax=Flavobacterium amniphilum TaxID=1834035 RepID=UPI00202A6057|nr:response regulator transcription factor [Flavobacterium amniphilum]MCL9807597.1 response regulator transcription factor [Flavobacterium amniphilum]
MMKVVLIEDYEILRKSLKEIVNQEEGYEVVGDFDSYESALPKMKELQPDIVLTDITLPGISGIEGIKQLKQLLSQVAIIVVSVHENSQYVFDALCAGAVGYLTKNSGKQKVVDALNQLRQGGAPMSVNIARMVVESFQQKTHNDLTQRENEVLDLLSKGKSYASIADELCLSVNTIKTHVKNIYEKLQVSSREELINKRF